MSAAIPEQRWAQGPSISEAPIRADGVLRNQEMGNAARVFVVRQFAWNPLLETLVLERQALYKAAGASESRSYCEACVDVIAWQRGTTAKGAAEWVCVWERENQ